MIGIIGFGRMGEAIALGLKGVGDVELGVFDIDRERRSLAQSKGLRVFSGNVELVRSSDVVILAVKPQVMYEVASEIKGDISDSKLVISIAAGISCEKLKKMLEIERVVRVMPNTPALVSQGAIALSFCGSFSEKEKELVLEIFSVLGRTFEVPESYMDAVTALSGSGPAYVFLFLEALSDAGVRVGLPRDLSLELAFQTLKGSIYLFESRKTVPREFIDMVTSPGGTTISALHILERAGFKGIVMDAVEAAWRRSKELGG